MNRPEPFGCSDHNCIFLPRDRGGMGTNGGCRCLPTHLLPEDKVQLKAWIRWLVEENRRLAEAEERLCTHNTTVAAVAATHNRRD